VERRPGRDQRLGEPRVVVGETLLGPAPAGIVGEPQKPSVDPGEEQCGSAVARMSRGDRGGTEDGVGVRARRGRREDGGAGLEAAECPCSELAGSARGGDPEPVERAAVRVVRSDPIGEAARSSGRAPVVKAAVGALRLLEKREVDQAERRPRLAGDRREGTRDVVGAVAVLGPRRAEARVLVEPDRVGERGEVQERRSREIQSALTAPAGCRPRVTCR